MYTKKAQQRSTNPRRTLKKQQKKPFFFRHPLIIPVTTFIMMFIVGLFVFVLTGASTRGAADARIVNVYIDGEQQTVTTRAKTIGDLVARLGLQLQKEDIIEPSKNVLILEDNTQVNVYRARAVEIFDGDRIMTVISAQRAPRLVAAEAGIKLAVEDEATFGRIDPNVLQSSASEQLVITRAVAVQLNVYGVIKQVKTTAETVGDLLADEGITPAQNELIQPAADTPLKAGMLIAVNRVGVETLAKTEKIAFETETKDDDSIEAGQSKIQRKGREGTRAVIYEVTKQDGKIVSRKKIQVVVLKKPVNQVVLRGTKIIAPSFNPSVTVSGDKASLMAAAGIASSDYGYVDFIVSHESGWRPGAANAYTGAYGLCQSLPASKMATAGADYLTNPITQLRWCSGYASGRYGSWAGAYAAWQVQGWW